MVYYGSPSSTRQQGLVLLMWGKGTKEDAAPAEEEQEETEAWAAMEEVPVPAEASGTGVADAAATAVGRSPAQAEHGQPKPTTKLYNSGASRHMSPFGEHFINYRMILPCPITAADKRIFYAVGTRDLRIEVPNGKSSTPIILKDVLHALDMGITIVVINCITKAGYTVLFDHECCKIQDKNHKHVRNIPVSITRLYKVECVYTAALRPKCVDLAMLHRQLTHIALDAICKMLSSGALEGVELTDDGPMATCEACKQAKAMHKQIQKECKAPLTDAVGVETHMDLWGPSPTPSMGGRRYYVMFTDDHSHYSSLTMLCTKDETLEAYKAYAVWMYMQHSMWIKQLWLDHGGKYTGNEFTKFLAEQGTECRLTTHDMPQHNGV